MRIVGMLGSSAAQRSTVRSLTSSMRATFFGVRYMGSAGRASIASAGVAIVVLLVEPIVSNGRIGLWVANLPSQVGRCR
ncbi:MAG: hypothetical protein DMD89_38115 [Candidatus Rokuibacteriota bacterium]|nr:MAG: hypothetical protein DMD89_38115 [Candidatus Rokubacteria bacterium]